MITEQWQKSPRSNGGDNCVEVRLAPKGAGVQVRHSKDPDGAILTFTKDEWHAFKGWAKDGGIDLGEEQ
jgi:hypothetical protein